MVEENVGKEGDSGLKSSIGIPGMNEETIRSYFDVAHHLMGNPTMGAIAFTQALAAFDELPASQDALDQHALGAFCACVFHELGMAEVIFVIRTPEEMDDDGGEKEETKDADVPSDDAADGNSAESGQDKAGAEEAV